MKTLTGEKVKRFVLDVAKRVEKRGGTVFDRADLVGHYYGDFNGKVRMEAFDGVLNGLVKEGELVEHPLRVAGGICKTWARPGVPVLRSEPHSRRRPNGRGWGS